MSQQKVDRYKEQKANRKKIMRKEKMEKVLAISHCNCPERAKQVQVMRKEKMMDVVRKIILSVVALALVGWLGFSGYSHYKADIPRPTAEIDYSAITNYMSGLQ